MATRTLFDVFGEGAPPSPLAVINARQQAEKEKAEKEINHAEITFLPIDRLKPYREHIFTPYSDEKLRELAEDIKEHGIYSPVLVRPLDGAYEILSGHNRTNAAKLAGLLEVNCTIKDYDDDTAQLVVVNSNLNQRENLLPSEKARAYKIQMECFNRRGKFVEKSDRIPDDSQKNQEDSTLWTGNDRRSYIYKLIRLNYLDNELLQAVDDDKLAVLAGAELSYIDRSEQANIYQYFFSDKKGLLDIKTAKLLRQRSQTAKLTYAEIEKLFQRPQKLAVIKAYKVSTKKIQQYIPSGTSQKDAETKIIRALKFYTENYKE